MDGEMEKKRTILRNSSKIRTIYATPHRTAQHPVLSDFQIWCSPGCQMHLD